MSRGAVLSREAPHRRRYFRDGFAEGRVQPLQQVGDGFIVAAHQGDTHFLPLRCIVTIQCECGHMRRASPKTFAAVAGWDALLADVV